MVRGPSKCGAKVNHVSAKWYGDWLCQVASENISAGMASSALANSEPEFRAAVRELGPIPKRPSVLLFERWVRAAGGVCAPRCEGRPARPQYCADTMRRA